MKTEVIILVYHCCFSSSRQTQGWLGSRSEPRTSGPTSSTTFRRRWRSRGDVTTWKYTTTAFWARRLWMWFWLTSFRAKYVEMPRFLDPKRFASARPSWKPESLRRWTLKCSGKKRGKPSLRTAAVVCTGFWTDKRPALPAQRLLRVDTTLSTHRGTPTAHSTKGKGLISYVILPSQNNLPYIQFHQMAWIALFGNNSSI